jgi:hypothetical protein
LDFETAFGLRRAYSEGDIQVWSFFSCGYVMYLLLYIGKVVIDKESLWASNGCVL